MQGQPARFLLRYDEKARPAYAIQPIKPDPDDWHALRWALDALAARYEIVSLSPGQPGQPATFNLGRQLNDCLVDIKGHTERLRILTLYIEGIALGATVNKPQPPPRASDDPGRTIVDGPKDD